MRRLPVLARRLHLLSNGCAKAAGTVCASGVGMRAVTRGPFPPGMVCDRDPEGAQPAGIILEKFSPHRILLQRNILQRQQPQQHFIA